MSLDAARSAELSGEESRQALFDVAKASLRTILDVLQERIREDAPAAVFKDALVLSNETQALRIELGEGTLLLTAPSPAPFGCLAYPGYEAPFDVIAYASLSVMKPRDSYKHEGRSHSLWFCDAQEEHVYRWFELAFMVHPTIPQRFALDPFGLSPTNQDAAGALAPITDVRQVAWQPQAFDQGDQAQFIERWLDWFASAVAGNLSHPSLMPEPEGRLGGYRRANPKPSPPKFPF
jgi:serine/threonine-protein kinase